MKILYDHQIFTWQRYGGISNSFVQLISNLPKCIDIEISGQYSDNIHLIHSGLKKVRPISKAETFLTKRNYPCKNWLFGQMCKFFPERTSQVRNTRESVRLLSSGNYDVFHPTFHDDYFLPYLKGKPFVLTVHDMIPELFYSPNDTQVLKKKILVQQAAHIISVSEHTKQDLIDILNVPSEKITTIYHGAPQGTRQRFPDIMDGTTYMLFVGKRTGYKAFLPMIQAISEWLRNHRDIKLVCTGGEFDSNELAIFQKEDITKQVINIQPDDNGMTALYQHALCFIFPSYYEGFGIPILEAYQAGCPVFLSNCSCFPEIAGDAAVYFDIDDNNSTLAEKLDNFLCWSESQKEKLLQRQYARQTMFSWEKSAKKLAEVYAMVTER